MPTYTVTLLTYQLLNGRRYPDQTTKADISTLRPLIEKSAVNF